MYPPSTHPNSSRLSIDAVRAAQAEMLEAIAREFLERAAVLRGEVVSSVQVNEMWPPEHTDFSDPDWCNTTEIWQDFDISERHLSRLLVEYAHHFAIKNGGRWMISRRRFTAFRRGLICQEMSGCE